MADGVPGGAARGNAREVEGREGGLGCTGRTGPPPSSWRYLKPGHWEISLPGSRTWSDKMPPYTPGFLTADVLLLARAGF